MAKKTITICFKESETDLYDFIKAKRNYSAFMKDLIEVAMKGQTTGFAPPIIQVNEVFKEEKKEEEVMAYDDF